MTQTGFSGNPLKIIAMVSMTADHLASVIWPGYPTDGWLLRIRSPGRLAAPVF